MHNVSALWQQIYEQPDHCKETAVTVNGVEYYEGRILNTAPSVSGKLFDAPSVGNARSRTLTLNLMPYDGPQGHISPMSEIRLYVRLKAADGQSVSEWIPKGVFYADEVKRDSDTGATRITAFDAIMKMERQFGNAVCRITFDDGFGGIQRFIRQIGDATPTPTTPTKEGYTFTGWTPTPAATVTADALYFAQWEAVTRSIAITAYPAKMTYGVGETLNYAGLTVTMTYSNGTTQDVTADCGFSPIPGTKVTEAGEITVTVYYGYETPQTFSVTAEPIGDDWWTIRGDGTLDIYCVGDMPDYDETVYGVIAYYSWGGKLWWDSIHETTAPWGTYAHELKYYAYDYDPDVSSWAAVGELIITRPALINALSIRNTVTRIGSYAFAYVPLQSELVIPDSVTEIGAYAFRGCASLTSVTIQGGVTEIYGAFEDCTALEHVELPDTLTVIDNYAFCGCTNLATIHIPESVTEIGYYAFIGTGLSAVTINRNCTVKNWAFPQDCAISYY